MTHAERRHFEHHRRACEHQYQSAAALCGDLRFRLFDSRYVSPFYLQNSVAEAKGKTLSEDDTKKVAGSLLDAIALRELAHKDSRKPLSADDIKKQREDILNRDNKQFSAYRAVLKKMEKSPTAMVRIVEGLDDKISLRAFKEKLVKDAGIQLKEKVDTKTVEKGAGSPEKKQG